MTSGQEIAAIAESQVGTTNGYKYLGGDPSEAWCDDFVSWVLQQAGFQGYGHQAYVPSSVQWAQQHGLWHANGSGYTPKVGDLVTFDWNGDGTADHIGVVTGVNPDGTIRVVSGNTNGYEKVGGESASAGAVAAANFSLNNKQVMGFISTGSGSANGTGNTFANAVNAPTEKGPNMGLALQNNLMNLLALALGGGMSGSDLASLENALGQGALAPDLSNIDPNFAGLSSGVSPDNGINYGGVDPNTRNGIIELARKVADQNGIPENIFLAVIDHESGFNPNALGDPGIGGTVNGKYASVGLGQVNTTAHPDFDVQRALHGGANGGPDIMYQLEYSAHMLKSLYQQYGSWELAVEHYNGSGPQAVQYANTVMNLASQFGSGNAVG
jgi:hypothetical protein